MEGCADRFDKFVATLLKNHDGVFFGELHDHPAMRQAVGKLLPFFKANGVATVSIELPQNLVDVIKDTANLEDLKRRWPRASEQLLGCFELVKAAQKLGLQVVGHEVPWPKTLEDALRSEQENEATIAAGRSLWAVSDEGMKFRDAFAAAHIRSHRRGKMLVVGGWNHSGNFTKADLDDPERETDDGYTKSHETRSAYQGLDVKLHIPSIDYRKVGLGEQIGGVNKASGKFSTYEVALPEESLGNLDPSVFFRHGLLSKKTER